MVRSRDACRLHAALHPRSRAHTPVRRENRHKHFLFPFRHEQEGVRGFLQAERDGRQLDRRRASRGRPRARDPRDAARRSFAAFAEGRPRRRRFRGVRSFRPQPDQERLALQNRVHTKPIHESDLPLFPVQAELRRTDAQHRRPFRAAVRRHSLVAPGGDARDVRDMHRGERFLVAPLLLRVFPQDERVHGRARRGRPENPRRAVAFRADAARP